MAKKSHGSEREGTSNQDPASKGYRDNERGEQEEEGHPQRHEEDALLGREAEEPKAGRWRLVWNRNKGAVFILLAEIIASSMDAMVRFLQLGNGGGGKGRGMHPFQVMFARMFTTSLLSSLYMWYTQVPDFPFGKRGVRRSLCLRALFGFAGLFCLYYSVHYLPLAEATVLRFLVPIITAYACSLVFRQVFTKKEFFAGMIALVGVVLIAHPESVFGWGAGVLDGEGEGVSGGGDLDEVSPEQRLVAIIVSLVGVLGASGAYTTIRIIGTSTHALISVNYFALLSTLGSTFALLCLPGMSFVLPQGWLEWTLLSLLGILGFALQFLLTAGLQLDRSSRATSMMYTQVLFALAFDWGVWGVVPGVWSWVGGAVVVGSTLWSALQKSESKVESVKKDAVDEESALLGAQTEGSEDATRRRSSGAA